MCCYITVGLDASDTGHLVDATLWKLCVRTTEEVWFISLTPLTRIDFILIARINNIIEATIILKSPEVTDSKLGPLLNAEKVRLNTSHSLTVAKHPGAEKELGLDSGSRPTCRQPGPPSGPRSCRTLACHLDIHFLRRGGRRFQSKSVAEIFSQLKLVPMTMTPLLLVFQFLGCHLICKSITK